MQIYSLALASGQATNRSGAGGPDSYPQWSPTGDQLLFHSGRAGTNDIFLMNLNAAGVEPRNLTNHPAIDELAVWSPDGRWIVFASDRDGSMDVYSLRIETEEVSRLSETSSHDWAPSWGR
jgi:TolB protein